MHFTYQRDFQKAVFPDMPYSTYANLERSDSFPKLEDAYYILKDLNDKRELLGLPRLNMEDVWQLE
jgi:hypothetical protein